MIVDQGAKSDKESKWEKLTKMKGLDKNAVTAMSMVVEGRHKRQAIHLFQRQEIRVKKPASPSDNRGELCFRFN